MNLLRNDTNLKRNVVDLNGATTDSTLGRNVFKTAQNAFANGVNCFVQNGTQQNQNRRQGKFGATGTHRATRRYATSAEENREGSNPLRAAATRLRIFSFSFASILEQGIMLS